MPPRQPTRTIPTELIQSRSSRRLRGTLAQHLAVQILKGEFAEGHMFPVEVEFAAQMGISRSSLREALQILTAKGLVEARPRVGTRVCPRNQWNLLDPDLLAWQFEARPSRKFLEDLFELRMMIEPGAAALAATRRTSAQLKAMETQLDAMQFHTLATEEGRAADQQFHRVMLEAAENQAILSLSSTIMSAVAWTTLFKQRKRKLPRDPIPDHLAVLLAIRDGDPDKAHRAMSELVRLALVDTEFSLGDD